MIEYIFKISCAHCRTEYQVKYSLPLDIDDIIYCLHCERHSGLEIQSIEKVSPCDCSKCTGLSSMENYYKDED